VGVPKIALSSIGFIGEVVSDDGDLRPDDLDPVGTGFIVSVPCKELPSIRTFCFVTARHVITGTSPGIDLAISVNGRLSGRRILETEGEWCFHQDKTVDLAAICLSTLPGSDVASFAVEDFFDPDSEDNRITVGDEVFFPGLFTRAPGQTQNTPIVRHGNLALLPDGPIQTNEGLADVYLIEARSIGGISGSPVFVRESVSFIAEEEDGRRVSITGIGETRLLGVIQAHWDVKENDINAFEFAHNPKGVNMGVALVVPAQKIVELMEHPDIAARRKKAEAELMDRWKGLSED